MKRVLLVGNCNKDGPAIKGFIEEKFDAEALDIKTIEEAINILEKEQEFDLIAVNRVGAYDSKNGLGLIDHIKEKNIEIPIMLITNFHDKMQEAIEHGAVQGFGKDSIYKEDEKAEEVLEKYLG